MINALLIEVVRQNPIAFPPFGFQFKVKNGPQHYKMGELGGAERNSISCAIILIFRKEITLTAVIKRNNNVGWRRGKKCK